MGRVCDKVAIRITRWTFILLFFDVQQKYTCQYQQIYFYLDYILQAIWCLSVIGFYLLFVFYNTYTSIAFTPLIASLRIQYVSLKCLMLTINPLVDLCLDLLVLETFLGAITHVFCLCVHCIVVHWRLLFFAFISCYK